MPHLSRLSIESLEDRANPAVVASVTPDGDLLVTGSTDPGQIAVVHQIAPNRFLVEQSGQTIGEFDVTRDVVVQMGDGNDQIDIELGGHTAPRDIRVDLGGGNNGSVIGFGTARNVTVRAGGPVVEIDVVHLARLQTTGSATVDLGDALSGPGVAGDFLFVSSSQIGKDLLVADVESVTFDENSSVGRDLLIATAAGTDTEMFLSGDVGRNLGLALGGGNDRVVLTGTVGGAAALVLGAGDDSLQLGADVGTVLAFGGPGTDTFVGDPNDAFLFGFEM